MRRLLPFLLSRPPIWALRPLPVLAGLVLAIGLAAVPHPLAAQGLSAAQRAEVVQILRDALRTDPGILRDALAALQADEAKLQERATEAALSARRAQLVSDGQDPVAGDPQGDVTLVYFYDTRCVYCRHMVPVLAELIRAEPRLRVVFKDLPILGPASLLEARALLAAQKQNRYAPMQDVFLRASGQPTRASLRADAERLGLDGARFLRDMDDPAVQAKLDANLALARALQLQGTPAIIVGNKMFAGAAELPALRQAVADARGQ